MRIFIIGFNRTGTRSLDNFFKNNGLPTIHWDQGRIARKIKRNHINKVPLLRDYLDIRVFSDMEDYKRLNYAHMDYFKQLYEQYPESKFILNIRNIDNWIKSRNNHLKGYYVIELCRIMGISKEELNSKWLKDYHNHYRNVTEFFSDKKDKLLIYDIGKDPINKIIEFIPEYKLYPIHYEHLGKHEGEQY